MRFGLASASALLALLAISAGPALADPITGLVNTGIDSGGSVATFGSAELYYQLITAPTGGLSLTVVPGAADYPGAWLAPNAISGWIAPNGSAAGAADAPAGTYDYRLTFTIAGDVNLASIYIAGLWASDNAGSDILVNGISTGLSSPSYSAFSNFVLPTAGLHTGVNTLDFVLSNDPCNCANPTGLRVQFTQIMADVPEPMSYALLGTGLLGLAFARRRAA